MSTRVLAINFGGIGDAAAVAVGGAEVEEAAARGDFQADAAVVAVAVAQAGGTDNVPIDMPRPKPNAVPPARPTFGIRARSAAALSNSAALLSEFS